MFDVISIGSSLVDIFVRSDEFSLRKSQDGMLLCQSYGDKIEVDEFVLRTGGGGSNTAVGFARMGFNAGVISEMGNDVWATMVLEELHQEHVSANFVVRERSEQTGGSVILVGEDGGRTVLVHRGAASRLDPHDIPTKQLRHTNWIHLSSISGRLETLKTIFQALLESESPGLSWNPGKGELQLLAEGKFNLGELPVTILFLNEEEWGLLEPVQSAFLEHTQHIVVTNGSKGGRVWWHGEWQGYHAEHINSVDDTGAGDSFATGYVSAILRDQDSATAVEWGKRNAASVITQVGAKPGLLYKRDVVQ